MPQTADTALEVSALRRFAAALARSAGLAPDHAGQVAETLVDGDCLGHGTHGLALLPRYLAEFAAGIMDAAGEMRALRDGGAVLLFDAGLLPGPVAMHAAIDAGLARLPAHGAVSLVVRNSGHIACLATYLERATRRDAAMLILSSNPAVAMVAPHGATRPVYSPDPLAFGFPTAGDPVLVDISLSAVSANGCRQAIADGARLSGAYLKRLDGSVVDDPAALFDTPPAAIMPLGGADLGHKGFGIGLMIEMLTSGLAGTGRSTGAPLSNSTFIYLADPQAFGGLGHMLDEASWLAAACRAAGHPGDVRLPGERALARRRAALADGLALAPHLIDALDACAAKAGIAPLRDASWKDI